MSTATTTQRSRLLLRPRFSLRTLCLLVLLIGLGCGVFQWTYIRPRALERAAAARVMALGGEWRTSLYVPEIRVQLPPDGNWRVVVVDLSEADDADAVVDAVLRFPKLRALAVGGPAFGDAHLRRLAELKHLELLVLDCTAVTEESLEDFHSHSPETLLRISQWRAMKGLKDVYATMGPLVGEDRLGPEIVRSPMWSSEDFNEPLMWNVFRAEKNHFCDAHDIGVERNEELAGLKYMKTVTFVTIRGPEINDDCIPFLEQAEHVTGIYPVDTKISPGGMERLKRCPHLKIRDIGPIYL